MPRCNYFILNATSMDYRVPASGWPSEKHRIRYMTAIVLMIRRTTDLMHNEDFTRTPQLLLEHQNLGKFSQHIQRQVSGPTKTRPIKKAWAARQFRMERGERPVGYIGLANRTIWERYNVFAPIWGAVWNTSLTHCLGHAEISLTSTCQPRLESKVVSRCWQPGLADTLTYAKYQVRAPASVTVTAPRMLPATRVLRLLSASSSR